MLPPGDSPQLCRQTQDQSEGMEDDTPNYSLKRGNVAKLISSKIDFKPKKGNKRQRWTIYNDKQGNSLKRYNSD